jgi:hypothetical protein
LLDPKQYGGKKKTGTEHMIVALMDRVLSLLDCNNTKSAVLMAAADWAAAFDRGDPTKTTQKLISLKLRPSIVPLLISYMSGRTMSLKFNQEESSLYKLCGGFPQGSKIGQDCFLSASNDSADHVPEEDRFKYIDDLQLLELIMLTGLLKDYDTYMHIPSDVPLDHKFLQGSDTLMQSYLDQIAVWTSQNLIKLNPEKSNYLLFSRAKESFVTRLTVNGTKIDQKEATKILGCWIQEDAGQWSKNTCELVKSAYSRISMLSKLKYTGVSNKDLLEIYSLFVRSRAEYMSVVWHSSLTVAEDHKIENIQKTSLKIILGENYVDYQSSLTKTGLKSLSDRRQSRCLAFAKRCLSNPQTKGMFPLNLEDPYNLREAEKYQVNFSRTENYKNSAVPFCQRLLNEDYRHEEQRQKERREQAKTRDQGSQDQAPGDQGSRHQGSQDQEGRPVLTI